MKKTPIHVVLARAKVLPLNHRIAFLRALIEVEPARSIRREELIAALKPFIAKQLKKETRLSA